MKRAKCAWGTRSSGPVALSGGSSTRFPSRIAASSDFPAKPVNRWTSPSVSTLRKLSGSRTLISIPPSSGGPLSAVGQRVRAVYGGALLFKADAGQKLGSGGLRSRQEHAPEAGARAAAIGMDAGLADGVCLRVIDKLRREPVEDFRIDFEDGFG